jgi:aminoglycoside/choline kinase family phosphotransferase
MVLRISMNADLEALVTTLGGGARIASVTEMPGGASTRRYFRLALDFEQASGKPRTAVAMFVPEGAKPEEIAKERARPRWPFLEVRELLAGAGVDVPALYAEDPRHGWLLLEDLGDDTLANYLARTEEARERLYKRAIADLARAQRALATLSPQCVIHSRAFDADLLRWELDHFREWGLEARGHALSAADRATFDGIAGRLAQRIASWPRGFVHRDYQSRNLMVRAGTETLCWIDFQDALLGPRVYDLVALLNDSYQTFDRAFVEARLREYASLTGEADVDALIKEFDYVTVQRKLKDAGRFVFIKMTKKNDSFMRFVGPTTKKALESLERIEAEDPDMKTLKNLLLSALP